jgi:uncharacterized membrane protein YjjP (DUF1212 family)
MKELFNQPDKRKHFLMCVAASLMGLLIAFLSTYGYWISALITGTTLAVGYELLQKYRKESEPSIMDALAGIFGAVLVSAIVALIELT